MQLSVLERGECSFFNSWRYIWPNSYLQLFESKQIFLQSAPQAHQRRSRDPFESHGKPQRLHQVHPTTGPHRQRSNRPVYLGEQDRCVVQLRN